MNLIDKDALVAEIKRIEYETNYEPFTDEVLGKRCVCRSLLSSINTLEVKDVDLEKEIDNFLDSVEGVPRMWHSNEQIEWGKDIAKHFFELGLQIH